jgi:hypothetical protein
VVVAAEDLSPESLHDGGVGLFVADGAASADEIRIGPVGY